VVLVVALLRLVVAQLAVLVRPIRGLMVLVAQVKMTLAVEEAARELLEVRAVAVVRE